MDDANVIGTEIRLLQVRKCLRTARTSCARSLESYL